MDKVQTQRLPDGRTLLRIRSADAWEYLGVDKDTPWQVIRYLMLLDNWAGPKVIHLRRKVDGKHSHRGYEKATR